ncbi:flippase-like domain-containing protein [Candidatus Woesearchaeota archaeon]|nr:flippase-like domain-containing protein [Candidatus Woesearchaeota archaeon]
MKIRSFHIKVFIGIAILFLLFYAVGISDIVNVLSSMRVAHLPLIMFIYIFSIFIASLNLQYLLYQIKFRMNIWRFFKYFFMNTNIGWIMPGKIGTFALVFLLKKKGFGYGQGTAVLIIDKLVTLLVCSIIGIVGVFVFFGGNYAMEFCLIIILGFLASFFFLIADTGRSVIKKYFLRKYAKIFTGFSKTNVSFLKKHKGVLLINTLITIIKTFLGAFYAFLIFISLGVSVPVIVLWYIWGIEFIVSLIPITLNGLGTRESVGLYLYSLVGVAPAVVLGRYVISLAIRYSLMIISFMLFDFKSFMEEVPDKILQNR